MTKYIIEIKDNSIVNITPITKSMEIETAKAILEEYVGDHIAVIGGGDHMSENQKAELRHYAKVLAPIEDEDDEYDECGYCEDEDDYDEREPNCGCHDNGGCECREETLDTLAARMILRIREILGE